MLFLRILLLPSLILLFTLDADADLYRYKDDNGRLHIVSSEDEVPPQYRERTKVTKTKPFTGKGAWSPNIPKWSTPTTTSNKKKPKVEVFVTSWCGYCTKLEKYLKKENIAFNKYNIEKNKKAKREHQKLGGGGVPVTRIGEDVVRGYSPERIKQVLAKYD